MKILKSLLFTIACISLGVVISVKAEGFDKEPVHPEIIQTIPPENVSTVLMGEKEFVVLFQGDGSKVYQLTDELSEEEREQIISESYTEHNQGIGLTNQEFAQAIQMIEEEMENKGRIRDRIHVEEGFRGFLRDIVTENFINNGDTIRTHYDKVDQLVDYMNTHYKRSEKVSNGLSTVTYTEFGATDALIQTATEYSDKTYEQLKKLIDHLGN